MEFKKYRKRIIVGVVIVISLACYNGFNKKMPVPSDIPVVTASPVAVMDEGSLVTPEVEATVEQTMRPELQEYIQRNEDVIGYIQIPDTKVDYPVLMGEDNEFYLTHDIDKKKTTAASIFVDYKYKELDIREEFLRHTLIYGHNMKNDSMFGHVVEYKKEKFFKEHPYIYFDNLYEQGKWKVFSVYVLDANQETIQRNFNEDLEYVNYLNQVKERSIYPVEVEVSAESKMITLSTCSYETENARTIVHALLVEDE